MKTLLSHALALLLAAAATAGEPAGKPADAKAAPAGGADEAAMMAAYEAMGKVGPAHKALEALVGKWKATSKVWMDPAQPPMVSEGSSEKKMILGGRHLAEEFKGSMMGKPFVGLGYTGYDNIKKQYVATWMDDMSTAIFHATGNASADGKTFTFTGETWDPAVGKDIKVRFVVKVTGPDAHRFEWFQAGPDGKEARTMEIAYTRM